MVFRFEGEAFYRNLSIPNLWRTVGLGFLASPRDLKQYCFDENGITWKNGKTFDTNFLNKNSEPIPQKELSEVYINLGWKNQAPDEKHASNHVYGVTFCPFRTDKPFSIGECIGSGFSAMEWGNPTR